MWCEEGSFWQLAASQNGTLLGMATCLACPQAHPGTWIANVTGVEACVEVPPLSRPPTDEILIAHLIIFTCLWFGAGVWRMATEWIPRYAVYRAEAERHIQTVLCLLWIYSTAHDLILALMWKDMPHTLVMPYMSEINGGINGLATFYIFLTVCFGLLGIIVISFWPTSALNAIIKSHDERIAVVTNVVWTRDLIERLKSRYCVFYASSWIIQSMQLCVFAFQLVKGGYWKGDVRILSDYDVPPTYQRLASRYQHHTLWIVTLVCHSLVCIDTLVVRLFLGWHRAASDDLPASVFVGGPMFPRGHVSAAARKDHSDEAAREIDVELPVMPTQVDPKLNPHLYESSQCVVCDDSMPEVLFYDCGHKVICAPCWEKLKLVPGATSHCLYCRQSVSHTAILRRI